MSNVGRRYLTGLCACAMCLISLYGCGPQIPTGQFSQAADFQPASIGKVTIVVRLNVERRIAGQNTEGVVSQIFEQALLQRGYRVDKSDAVRAIVEKLAANRSEWTGQLLVNELRSVKDLDGVLLVELNEDRVVRRRYDEIDRNGNRYRRDGVAARCSIGATLLKVPTADTLWSGFEAAEREVFDPNDSSVEVASALVANGLPFRVLPVNKKGERYDPRITSPNPLAGE